MNECSELLKKLCNLRAVTGRENMAAEKIAEVLRNYCDEVTIDPFFNVIGLKKGQSEPLATCWSRPITTRSGL